MISKIKFKNFKLFKEKQTLEIKPITIVIGKNNTGKTAILHLPVIVNNILNQGITTELYKININSGDLIELGTNFEDLVYNKSPLFPIELDISDSSLEHSIRIVANKNGILELLQNDLPIDIDTTNKIPNVIETKLFQYGIDYITGIRINPEYNYQLNNHLLETVGIKGENTYQILIQDFKKSKQLINKVSGWYEKNFEGWAIDIIENKLVTETNYSVAISTNHITPINIRNAGKGIHQVLPLITSSFLEKQSPTLIIIEEPETHLHPAAHANLAERFVHSYLEDKNKNYLIETHSLNFLLRVRRLVAEGKLSHNDLKIYYVDYDESSNQSWLKDIVVDSSGSVKDWPDGIFAEAVLEARAIMNAKQNNLKNVD